MKPYYQDGWVTQYCSDALTALRGLESDTVDLLCTDPPYGISFMGKSWDKALPDINVWKECLRVLKPGAFAFVMSIPRQDCLARMIINLQDAGFEVGFTPIYWAYASGFPKAQNIGKAVDKRLGVEREVIRDGFSKSDEQGNTYGKGLNAGFQDRRLTKASSPQAKALDGSYGGMQVKPAVEVIIVCMKPLSEKTFVDQALKNRKGITWLDDCRIPYNQYDKEEYIPNRVGYKDGANHIQKATATGFNVPMAKNIDHQVLNMSQGRFPANLLVSDDVLNDGRVSKSHGGINTGKNMGSSNINYGGGVATTECLDSGSFSRYFDLDKWWAKTFPFLIVPKASKSEKNKGLDMKEYGYRQNGYSSGISGTKLPTGNTHPTVKPLKLMSYLITLGSREGDTVLDPYMGSGTTALASQLLNRKCIGIELEEKYCEIAAKRCSQSVMRLDI